MDPAVSIGGRQQHSIGAELTGRQPLCMFFDFKRQFFRRGGVHANHFLRTTDEDLLLIGAQISRQNGIDLFIQRRQPTP